MQKCDKKMKCNHTNLGQVIKSYLKESYMCRRHCTAPGEQMDGQALCKLEHLSSVCFLVVLQLPDPLVIQHSTYHIYQDAVKATLISSYVQCTERTQKQPSHSTHFIMLLAFTAILVDGINMRYYEEHFRSCTSYYFSYNKQMNTTATNIFVTKCFIAKYYWQSLSLRSSFVQQYTHRKCRENNLLTALKIVLTRWSSWEKSCISPTIDEKTTDSLYTSKTKNTRNIRTQNTHLSSLKDNAVPHLIWQWHVIFNQPLLLLCFSLCWYHAT